MSAKIQDSSGTSSRQDICPLNHYQKLVATGTWDEVCLNEDGLEQTISVTAEIWTAAIQTALKNNKTVTIPYRQEPYYIDGPLILRSGNHLLVDPGAEIRLKPSTNTCMLRNEKIVNGQYGHVNLGTKPDTNIVIEGGIWTTLAVSKSQSNGNIRGRANSLDSFFGAHGVILLHNVKQVQVKNLVIKQCRPFGIQMGNCSEFLIENIFFDNTWRDGVHIEGPAEHGIIRNIDGVTGDDIVALNAWDWKHSSITFGPIENILVQNIVGRAENLWAEMRLLAGTKKFVSGNKIDCNITNCVIKDIHNIPTFKIYDQPNGELGRDIDFADPIGQLYNICFEGIHVNEPVKKWYHPSDAVFQIAANIHGMTMKNIILNFDLDSAIASGFKLVRIGPMSWTYKPKENDPNTWVELYSPDKDCRVKNLNISGVQTCVNGNKRPFADIDKLVDVRNQVLNPDYPNTTPKGGTGKGYLENPQEK